MARQVIVLFPLIIIAMFCGVLAKGQDDSSSLNLLVQAQVLNQEKPFENVTVRVVNSNKVTQEVSTKENGFFSLTLNFDSVYTLSFVRANYVIKTVEVDTRNMPDEDKELGYDLGMFKMTMMKLSECKNPGLYKKPIARFKYNDVSRQFVVDRSFKKEVKKRFEESDQKQDIIKF